MRSMHYIKFNFIELQLYRYRYFCFAKIAGDKIYFNMLSALLTIKKQQNPNNKINSRICIEFSSHAHDLLIFGIFVFIYITLLQTSFNMHSAHHNSNQFHVSREIYEKLKIIKENHKRMFEFEFEFEHRLIQIFVFFFLVFSLFLIKTISYLNLYLSDTTSHVC